MEIGDKGLIIRRGLKPLMIPLGAPQVGDKVICIPIGNRMGYVAVPLGTPQVGDTVALLPEGGTRKYVAVPITIPSDPCVDWVSNIIVNGDFETGAFPPWVRNRQGSSCPFWSISTVEKYEGVYGAYDSRTQSWGGTYWNGIEQTLDLLSTDYVTGYVKGSTNWYDFRFEFVRGPWSNYISLKTYVGSEWTKFCFKLGDIPGWGDGSQTVGFYTYTNGQGSYWLALDKVVLHRP